MRPFIIYKPGQSQRRRQAKPKKACKRCSAKRVPSDREVAICDRCLKAEKKNAESGSGSSEKTQSITGDSTESSTALVLREDADEEYGFNLLQEVTMGLSNTEGMTLDRFVKRFIPSVGIFMDANVLTGMILPATHSNNQVFHAALAITVFYDLPMNDIWSKMQLTTYEKYQTGMKWYRKSLKQSMQAPPDKSSPQSIALSLLTIVLYHGIENRQLNWHAQEGLIRAAFAIVYNFRDTIRDSKNTSILLCLSVFMDIVSVQNINPGAIPRAHWQVASDLAYNLSDGCNITENYIVRFELYRIMYDVNIVIARGYGSDFELECRMQRWLAHLNKFESSLPLVFTARLPALRCRFCFGPLQIAWEAYLYGQNVDRKDLQARLNRILGLHEMNEKNTSHVQKRPTWYLDTGVVPSLLWVAWYWRSETVYVRIRNVFEGYQDLSDPKQTKLVRIVLEYLKILVHTPYHKATQVELEMFGHKPRVLLTYQSYRYVDHLIRTR